jgi:hypothetical protein
MAWDPKDMPRNWGEFKAAVEAMGVKDADHIRYIDWSGNGGPPEISREDNGAIVID